MKTHPWFVSGFVDGEGSFLVSFSVRDKMSLGIEVRPSFTVSQHERSLKVLNSLQSYFGCGSIRFNNSDQTYKYEVRSLNDLIKKVIPHFEQYPLMTSKQSDFEALRDICRHMSEKTHLSPSGMTTIIKMAYQMNNLGARRYSKEDLLRIVGR